MRPDPSLGECPMQAHECDDTGKPAVCKAVRYESIKLNPEQVIFAWGSNECKAKNELRVEACKLNLRPTQIKGVKCRDDKTNGACPPKTAECDNFYEPITCKGKLELPNNLFILLDANGFNKCDAMAKLELLACRKESAPSELKEVNCVKDQP